MKTFLEKFPVISLDDCAMENIIENWEKMEKSPGSVRGFARFNSKLRFLILDYGRLVIFYSKNVVYSNRFSTPYEAFKELVELLIPFAVKLLRFNHLFGEK